MLKSVFKSPLMITFYVLAFMGLSLGLLAIEQNKSSTGALDKNIALVAESIPKIPEKKEITILAVGDIMMHQAQLDSALKNTNSGTNGVMGTTTYDFSSYFSGIKKYLTGGDIVYANLETPVAGKELKYSGYPKFNAPNEILTELKINNFTHLSLASNHALDRGWSGLSKTIKNVESEGFTALGARESSGDASKKPNYEISIKNGIKIGMLSYVYATNGFTLPKGKTYMLSYINKEQIKKDLMDLKSEGVDVSIVAIHFGDEYKLQENQFQKDIAKFACDNGANIILGSHPHVLEPMKFINENCFVAYSLGNFISGMTNPYTDLGGILKIKIEKSEGEEGGGGAEGAEFNQLESGATDDGVVTSSLKITPSFFPTWVRQVRLSNGKKHFEVLPLAEDELLKTSPEIKLTNKEVEKLKLYRQFVDEKIF